MTAGLHKDEIERRRRGNMKASGQREPSERVAPWVAQKDEIERRMRGNMKARGQRERSERVAPGLQ